jgi:hypothetical protein
MSFLTLEVDAGNQSWAGLPSQTTPIPGLADPTPATSATSAASASTPSATATEQIAWVRCPQDLDCPDGGLASRIFECQEGCGYRGCAACMEIHEAEPHADDSATLLEMARNAGGRW